MVLALALLCGACQPPSQDAASASRARPGFHTYRSAVEASRRCVADAGFDVTPLQDLPDGLRVDFGVDEGDRPEEEMWATWDDCRRRHSYDEEVAYFAALRRPATELSLLRADLAACVTNEGVDGVTATMSDGEIASAMDQQQASVSAWACRERFLILTGAARPRPPLFAPSPSPDSQ